MPKSKQRRPTNPIQAAVEIWLASLPAPDAKYEDIKLWQQELLDQAPKRFTIYEPMVLLPSGSFTTLPWTAELRRHSHETCDRLWSLILVEVSKGWKSILTHLAVNEVIPLHEEGEEDENILRSPSGLKILLGNFGPANTHSDPSEDDFTEALWVSTKQNGIHQTWAPRWTMFSRGNIKEKARLLQFARNEPREPDGSRAADAYAVDLYAGIGYFVFSYASLGYKVLCWEINPWSVEGLRRGAGANRWTVKIVQGDDLKLPTEEVLTGEEQIVVFLESNEQGAMRIKELHAVGLAENVRHVNCGFLPTSEPTWEQTSGIVRQSPEAWLHLHENVGVDDTETRRKAIEGMFETWTARDGSARTPPKVEHIEFVKTFAPGVWHCVFDVHYKL